MSKVVSFSLWGSAQGFLDGAVANAELARVYYPGWLLQVYLDAASPPHWRRILKESGYTVTVMEVGKRGEWERLFWRFLPVEAAGVDAFISRDLDSRINPREAAAVEAWLASGKTLHAMRDAYQHIVPIPGGMWGCRHWPKYRELLDAWGDFDHKGCDQDFLAYRVWPLLRTDCLAHDRYPVPTRVATPTGPFWYHPFNFPGIIGGGPGMHDVRPFPIHAPMNPELHGNYVGAVFGRQESYAA